MRDVASRPSADGVWQVTVGRREPDRASRRSGRSRCGAAPLLRLRARRRSRGGAFVSLLDPPPDARRDAVAACRNEGVYPVLVGERRACWPRRSSSTTTRGSRRRARAICSTATEIDEILTLRIMTLTDDEKREASRASTSARARAHRAHRGAHAGGPLRACTGTHASRVRPDRRASTLRARRPRPASPARQRRHHGHRSGRQDRGHRLDRAGLRGPRPRGRRDVDDDPGRDLGALGQPGHRFFFAPEEVEPLR